MDYRQGGVAAVGLKPGFWHGRRVLVTGHTGFKGGWLSLWLQALGARVHGYALPATSVPSLWRVAGLDAAVPGELGDLRDRARLEAAIAGFRPEIVLHLAAQPLVRESYRDPASTYEVNVGGTVNLLEAVRRCDSVRVVVVVSSDKCYENREWAWPYREQDALGGHDPYSSSKACVELLCASWRASFLAEHGVGLATARAGNVIGGGDWSPERLVPDVLHSWQAGQPVILRNPGATRPWQHVLEPLHGYLLLAQALVEGTPEAACAWNFGPDSADVTTVATVVAKLASRWPGDGARWDVDAAPAPHEARLLALDSARARAQLRWSPRWSLDQAIAHTMAWHLAWREGKDMLAFTSAQIAAYQEAA